MRNTLSEKRFDSHLIRTLLRRLSRAALGLTGILLILGPSGAPAAGAAEVEFRLISADESKVVFEIDLTGFRVVPSRFQSGTA